MVQSETAPYNEPLILSCERPGTVLMGGANPQPFCNAPESISPPRFGGLVSSCVLDPQYASATSTVLAPVGSLSKVRRNRMRMRSRAIIEAVLADAVADSFEEAIVQDVRLHWSNDVDGAEGRPPWTSLRKSPGLSDSQVREAPLWFASIRTPLAAPS